MALGQQSGDSLFNLASQSQTNLSKIETLAKITNQAKEYPIADVITAIEWIDSLAIDSLEVYILYNQNNKLGNYFRYLGFDDEGLKYFEKNNLISQRFQLVPEYLNIGLIYHDQGDYSTAKSYFLKSRNGHYRYGVNNQAYGYYFYGRSILKNKPDSSNYYVNTAIAIWESIPLGGPNDIYYFDKREPGALTQAYHHLGLDALQEGDFIAAGKYAEKVKLWANISSCSWGSYYSLKAIINLKNKNLDSAIYFALKNLEESQKPNCGGFYVKDNEAESHSLIATMYEQNGSIEEAYMHYKKYVKLKNEVKSSSNQMAVQFHKFEKDKLTLEKGFQKELLQEKILRNVALASGLLLLLISAGFYNRWQFVRKSRAIIKKEKDSSENLLINILT
jgi:tetratricopeptide (TPR) repeat protein